MLALGNSTYEKFCEAGKRLDRRFEELGATRLLPRVDCDVDYDEPAAVWTGDALALLARDHAATTEQAGAAVAAVAKPKPAAFDKKTPFPATIIEYSRPDRPRFEQGDSPYRVVARRVGARVWSRATRSASRRATTPRWSQRSSAASASAPPRH